MKKEKKEKVVLTPEEKAERKAQRQLTARLGFKEGIIPFFIQMGILVIVILEFAFLIGNKAFPLLLGVPEKIIGGEVTNNPNIVRFIYMFLCIPAVVALIWWSTKVEEKSKVKAFWISLAAGILAWQAIGECSWHFGLFVESTYVFFPQIEGVQGTFILLLIIPVLLYINKRKGLNWTMQIFLLVFFCNFVGHWVILGIAPWWPTSLRYHNPGKWPKVVGFVVGLHGSLMLIYKILFKAKTTEERLVLSVLLYTFVGIFVEGAFGVGGSLE